MNHPPSPMTQQEAIDYAATKWWVEATALEIVEFSLAERRLCCPFSIVHQAIEKVLGRSVWTHEFAFPDLLRAELEGILDKPSMKEIIDKLPKDKTIILVKPEPEGKTDEQ